jgi:hypothetical protein
MAETLEHRDKLQLDAETETELGDALGDGMTALAPLTDRLESLESEYQMETNRLRNEGELQG